MMVELDDFVDIRALPGKGRLFQTLAPFGGWIDGKRFNIPAGFVTDFASVPKPFENVFTNNDPDMLRPSLPHDWLYQFTGAPPYTEINFTRAQADAILRDGMRHCGASWLRRWIVWAAVRIGGIAAWHGHLAAIRRSTLRSEAKQAMRSL